MRAAIIAIGLALAGCQSPAEYQAQQFQSYRQACWSMGIVYNPALDNCILQQQQIAEMQRQRQSAAMVQMGNQLLNPQPAVMMPSPMVRCVSNRSYGNVYTTCR